MFRIGFVGVPGTGKTSTARMLSACCRRNEKFERVELIAEYARRYIAKYGSIDSVVDQYKIMEKQIEWESAPPHKETDLIITDSPVHLGFLYVMEYDRSTQKGTMYMNDIFKRLNKVNYPTRYDIIFHLPPILKPVEDGVRKDLHFDEKWRVEADTKIKFIFEIFPPKQFITITSSDIMDRVDECLGHMEKIVQK